MCKARSLFIILTVAAILSLTVIVALAVPLPDDATAAVTVTVATIGEWVGNFSTIALADITAQNSAPTGSQTATLYTNGDLDITADNTTAAQLVKTGDPTQTLTTSYMLTDDGDGIAATGGTDETEYTEYDTFLSGGYAITHVPGDGVVEITLNAKAENPSGEVADAGDYTATQTLTATW
jgi:hypothetical protein